MKKVVAAPFLKWAGGKTKLLPELARRCPANYRHYFEPFAGGAALFFHLMPASATLGDLNEDLINAYRCVALHPTALIDMLGCHRGLHCERHYYATRDRWNDDTIATSSVERAAMFIYLNKTCYNGLWRVNSRGEFNVPIGSSRKPQIFDEDALRHASWALQGVALHAADYQTTVVTAGADDLVYFDPPYMSESVGGNFTNYTAAGFDPGDHACLAETARDLVARGATVLVSARDSAWYRALYDGFEIFEVECMHAMGRRSVGELIIKGVPR